MHLSICHHISFHSASALCICARILSHILNISLCAIKVFNGNELERFMQKVYFALSNFKYSSGQITFALKKQTDLCRNSGVLSARHKPPWGTTVTADIQYLFLICQDQYL